MYGLHDNLRPITWCGVVEIHWDFPKSP